MEMQIKTEQGPATGKWRILIYAEGTLVASIAQSFDDHSEPWLELQKILDEEVHVYLFKEGRWHWTWPCGDAYMSASEMFPNEDSCRECADNCEAIVRKVVESLEGGG